MTHQEHLAFDGRRDEVFDLLSNPERFAPLMPDFESMTIQDATHFTMRTRNRDGRDQGSRQPCDGVAGSFAANRVEYAGLGDDRRQPASPGSCFQLDAPDRSDRVNWQGECDTRRHARPDGWKHAGHHGTPELSTEWQNGCAFDCNPSADRRA